MDNEPKGAARPKKITELESKRGNPIFTKRPGVAMVKTTLREHPRLYNSSVRSYPKTSNLKEIVEALGQPNTSTLGVYGSSNASKPNLVKPITRRVERDGVFDVVVHVMASVMKKNTRGSKSPDISRIQEELGKKLDVQFRDKSTLEERARLLCQRIKMEEKILIILDDVQDGINLGEIGIPFGNDHMGCKVVLIAPTQDVLSNPMNNPEIQFSADAST